jgi:hypothetical protein
MATIYSKQCKERKKWKEESDISEKKSEGNMVGGKKGKSIVFVLK